MNDQEASRRRLMVPTKLIVDLNLAGKHAIVIGGGVEGTRKVKGLLGQGCKITVISNRLNKFLKDHSSHGAIEVLKAKLDGPDILENYKDAFLILAATNDKELNRRIIEKGRLMGAFVYAADDPSVSDFSYASVINIDGIMQIAISTSGRSPIVARKVRIRAERVLRRIIRKTDVNNARLQDFARHAAKRKLKTVSERKAFLYSLITNQIIQKLIKEERIEDAKSVTLRLLQTWEQRKL